MADGVFAGRACQNGSPRPEAAPVERSFGGVASQAEATVPTSARQKDAAMLKERPKEHVATPWAQQTTRLKRADQKEQSGQAGQEHKLPGRVELQAERAGAQQNYHAQPIDAPGAQARGAELP